MEDMADHPEFPQETPATKYIIEQVSKIQDAQACSSGYYKSLSKVLTRLDKTDTVLNQLKESTLALQKVAESDVVAITIGKKSDEITSTLRENMNAILVGNTNAVSSSLAKIEYENKELNKGFIRLMGEIGATNKKLNSQIATINGCLVIPSWKAWVYTLLTLIAGIGIAAWVL